MKPADKKISKRSIDRGIFFKFLYHSIWLAQESYFGSQVLFLSVFQSKNDYWKGSCKDCLYN